MKRRRNPLRKGLRCRPNKNGSYHYTANVDNYGVYECSVKRVEDMPDGLMLGRTRSWFIMFDGERYDLPAGKVKGAYLWLRDYLRNKTEVHA